MTTIDPMAALLKATMDATNRALAADRADAARALATESAVDRAIEDRAFPCFAAPPRSDTPYTDMRIGQRQ